MRILAHRGLWTDVHSMNSIDSFRAAFENDFGIEIDVRDYNGNLVVSHDIATAESKRFSEILSFYNDLNCNLYIAINIKSDGIQSILMSDLRKYSIDKYFVFDMSVPEQVLYEKQSFNFFTRMSEYETYPVLKDKAAGIWMDEWEVSWITPEKINEIRALNKQVAVVSPEIHGRDKSLIWRLLKQFKNDDDVMLCTDCPAEAKEYFE